MIFDVATDTATAAEHNLLQVKEATILYDAFVKIEAAVVGTSSTVMIGRTGDTNCIMADTAEASLTKGAYVKGHDDCRGKLMAANDYINLTIGTAALTAGRIKVVAFLFKAEAL